MAKKNPYLKKAGVLDEYDVDQMHELLRCATDPLYFIDTYCKIIHPLDGVVPFKLHGYQRNLIYSYHNAANTIVLSPRQTGKCYSEDTIITIIPPWQTQPRDMTVGELHILFVKHAVNIYNDGQLKFIEQSDINNKVLVQTPTGYVPIKHSFKTVPYTAYDILLDSGQSLRCADTHILITEDDREIYVKDLILNQTKIKTKHGHGMVISIQTDDSQENMYDLELTDINHVYYTNDIVSHNSTTVSAYLLWFAIFHENKHILIVSNRNSGSMEMISRIEFMYEHLPHWLKPSIDSEHWNMHSKWFSNGSKLDSEATTTQSGRGLAISLLFCDEFAHVDPSVAEAFWTSISPTLATGGKTIIASTPNGDSNLYAQLWRGAQAGANGFHPVEIKWDEPPGRDDTFKQAQIGKLGILKWEQEYECRFLSSDPLLINSLFLSTYKVDPLPEMDARGIVWFEAIDPKQSYIIGIDPATGSENDFTVISLFSFPNLSQVAEFRSNTTSSAMVYTTFKYMIRKIISMKAVNIYFSVENNGVGEGFIGIYQTDDDAPEYGEFISEEGKNRDGMNTNGKSKLKACINFKNLFEGGRIQIKSINAINEMKEYVRKAGSYAARRGATDDCISSILIVVRILDELVSYEDNVYEILYDMGEVNEFITTNSSEDAPLPMIIGSNGFYDSKYANYKVGKFIDPNDPNSFDPWGDYPYLG